MTTQDKEAVEAAKEHAGDTYEHRMRWGLYPSMEAMRKAKKEAFLAGVEFQKQREKPVNGELEGDD